MNSPLSPLGMDIAQLQCVLGSERLGVMGNFHHLQSRFLSFKPLFAIRTAMQGNGHPWGSLKKRQIISLCIWHWCFLALEYSQGIGSGAQRARGGLTWAVFGGDSLSWHTQHSLPRAGCWRSPENSTHTVHTAPPSLPSINPSAPAPQYPPRLLQNHPA